MAFCTAAVDPTAQHCEAICGLSCRFHLFAAVQVRKSFRIAFIEGDIMSVGFSKDQCTHIVRARPNMLTDVTQTMKKEELRVLFTNDIVEVPICMHARVHATAAVDGVRHPQPAGRAGGRRLHRYLSPLTRAHVWRRWRCVRRSRISWKAGSGRGIRRSRSPLRSYLRAATSRSTPSTAAKRT
jgi:hypothetical protein